MRSRLHHAFIYLLTIACGQGLSFLLLPVVTNYLTPTQYGDYALALAVSTLAGTLGSSWVRNLSFRLYFEARRERRTRSFFITIAAFQAAVVIVLYVPVAVGASALGRNLPLSVMLAAGTAVLAGDFYAHAVSLMRAEQDAIRFSFAEIGSAVVRFAATLLGLVAGLRSSTHLFLSASLAAGVAGVYVARALRSKLTGAAFVDRKVIRELARYGPASLPHSLSGWVERLVDRPILDYYLTREVVGLYSANASLADRLIGGITSAVHMMAWPDALRTWSERGHAAAREALAKGMSLYLCLTVGPTVFIVAFSGEVAQVLGPAYRRGAAVMPIIAVATWLCGFNKFLNRHLELKLRFATLSWVALAGAALNVVLKLLLVPRFGIQGAAVATLANYVATGVAFWSMRDRELVRLPVRETVGVMLLACGALLASRFPTAGLARAATFAAFYGVGALVAAVAIERKGKRVRVSEGATARDAPGVRAGVGGDPWLGSS